MKFHVQSLFLAVMMTSAEASDELVYGTDAKDSLGRAVRIIETIRSDGSGRRRLLSGDFIGENFWPGYRGSGPAFFDEPDVSPLGRRVLFTNTYNLYSIEWSGGPAFSLTRFTREKYQPRWSPDGRRIAFVSDLGNNCEIYIMNADASGLRNISWNKSANLSPSWSPSGDRIAFISNRNGRFELFVSDLDGFTQERIFSLDGDIREPDWGSGNRIVFSVSGKGRHSIISVKPDGSDKKIHFSTPFWSGHPAWHPDGSRIAYSSVRSGNADIWIFDPAANSHFNVTRSPETSDYFPRWVPKQLPDSPPAIFPDRAALKAAGLDETDRTGVMPLRAYPASVPAPPLPRPRMLFLTADLPVIRARLESPPLRAAWKRFLRQCDSYLEDRRIAESLKKIPDDPLRKRYAIPAFAELYYRAPWLDALFSLSFAARVTGEEKFRNKALAILLEAAERYRTAYGVMHCDYRVACAYDWLWEFIPEAEKKQLDRLLLISMEQKLSTCLHHVHGIYGSSPGGGNYAIYFAASLGPIALAMAGTSALADESLNAAERLAFLTLNRWIAPEGDAQEGFSYFAHPVGELLPFLVSLQKNGRGAELVDSNLKKVFFWMAVSAGKAVSETPAIGDSDYLPLRLPTGLLALYGKNPLLRKLWNRVPRSASELNTVTGLLWWEPSEASEQDFSELPSSSVFPHSGYAVLRTGSGKKDSVLTVSAPRQAGHAHLEYGAVTLSANGLRFLADAGQSVPASDYHSQILLNGQGRWRSSFSTPLLGALRRAGNVESVTVDFSDAFSVSCFGVPDYSGIPCGRAGLRRGIRTVAMVKASDGVPPYFLIHDSIRTDSDETIVEQVFTADQGMRIDIDSDGTVRIGESVRDTLFQSTKGEDRAAWDFEIPEEGSFFLHIYARSRAGVELEADGQRRLLTYLQPPSRPDTWQWRSLSAGTKPFQLRLPAGKHRIALRTSACFHSLALSQKSSLTGEAPDTPEAVVLLKNADAQRTGTGWKKISPAQAELHIISLLGHPEVKQYDKRFTTRFHGQLLVVLPQFRLLKRGKSVQFLTLLCPFSDGTEKVRVKDGILHWKSATDEIVAEEGNIKINRRVGNESER